MPLRLKRRPLIILTSVTLAALLLGGCAGAANTSAPLPADTPIVYTMFDNNGGSGVTAISGRDGKTLWHAAIGHSNWAPLIVGDTLFACIFDPAHPGQTIVAVRMRDGKLLWRTSLSAGDGFNDVFAADAATVAVNADRGGLYALDAASGAIRWHQSITPAGRPTVRGGAVYAILRDPAPGQDDVIGLAAFRASDGQESWRAPVKVYSNRIEANDAAIFGNPDPDGAFALGPADGRAVWKGASPGWVIAATDRMVLGVTSDSQHRLFALDPADGHVVWRSSADFGTISVSYDVVPISDEFIYGSHDREVVAVRASDGTEAWRAQLDNGVVYGVVATGGVVFVSGARPGSDDLNPCFINCALRITAFDGKTGAQYWQVDTPGGQLLAEFAPAE